MQLRGIPIAGNTLQQMKQIMHNALHMEQDMKNLITQIECNKEQKEAMIRIMTIISCILHMENIVGLKMLTMLLIKGLSSA